MSAYAGLVPLEMTGGSPFPPIGELNYLLTLPPYGFYWFLLADETQQPDWYRAPPEPLPEHLTFVLRNDLRDLLEPAAQNTLERDVLPAYLSKRRWFGGKGTYIRGVRIVAIAMLPRSRHAGPNIDCAQVLLTEIEVDTGTERQHYQIPLTIFFEDHPMPALAHQLALARVRRRQRVGVLTGDAPWGRGSRRDVGPGNWAYVGDGFYIRTFSRSYSTTTLEVFRTGTADISARVYGCTGLRYSAWPAYMVTSRSSQGWQDAM